MFLVVHLHSPPPPPMLHSHSQTFQSAVHPWMIIITGQTRERRRRRRKRRSRRAGGGEDKEEEEEEEQGFCSKPFLAFAHSSSSSCCFNYNKLQRACFLCYHDARCRLHAKRAAMVLSCLCGDEQQSHHFPRSQSTASHDKKARIEYLWQELFSDPSKWWDNRLTKKSTGQPDFKHRTSLEALWIDNWLNPPWVKEKFATLAFDPIQPWGRSFTSRVPASFGNYDKVQKFTREGRLKEALGLLELMAQQRSVDLQGAFVCILRACIRRKALTEGKQAHALVIKTKRDTSIFLSNLLIEMYSVCNSVSEALKVFTSMPQRNVFSWTAMISAYAKNAQYKEGVALFRQMCQAGIEPDMVVCIVALKACKNIAALEEGQKIHSIISKKGFDSNVVVQTTLVDMYAKCGCLESARKVFDNMAERDVISWNAMITAYAQEGLGKEALDLYEQMKGEAMDPDNVTLVLLLKACASFSALQQGKQLHSLVLKKGLESDIFIQTALLDMYAKCGCLEYARELFDNMAERNVISWNAMIAGYAQEGLGKEALDLLKQMRDADFQADEITYTSVLSACSHSGFVDEGQDIFKSMSEGHGGTPTLEHYTCMVDLLGRAGCLSDAEEFILKMPIQPDTTVWMSLLGASRKYLNVEIGRRAFERIVELEPENAPSYALLMDIYSAAGRMDEVAQVRNEMNKKGVKNIARLQLD